jgi:hypothetical protein
MCKNYEVLFIITLIMYILNFTIAIKESIVLGNTKSSIDDLCSYEGVWYAILMTCLIHYFDGIVTFGLSHMIIYSDPTPSQIYTAAFLSTVFNIFISIWTLPIQNNMSSICTSLYIDKYNSLWVLIEIENIIAYVYGALYALFLLFMIGRAVYKQYQKYKSFKNSEIQLGMLTHDAA